jgi:hypothetical protein
MSINPQDTALMAYLKVKGITYHAKVLELREVIEGWLSYIPNTFPHYTRHTIRHSDEIVHQMSKLLFRDEDIDEVVLPLTAVEAYLIIAAAYLHDAGMVISDREKLEIAQSDEWKIWISDSNAGAKRWDQIQTLRNGKEPADSFVRNFLADLETRFLIAEFVRRAHHLRARSVIEQHQSVLGRFAFDDLVLQRTIADVCVAHGLKTYELEDNERFPDRRDIRGNAVNVRLMAILLRLGDLLDMSADRACPLLLNAACPLPADSLAHWTQYQRITHRLTAPDRIEITAECENQNEHRVLQDWCQWIVDEVHAARTLLSRSKRHHDFELPIAENEGSGRTIVVRPAPTANYFPSNWTFQLDHDAVFQRLIFDAYEGSEVFIRELIQNSLDACRCQMYADVAATSTAPPDYPTQVSEEIRAKYPVSITLRWIESENLLSGEKEKRQVLKVSDSGIGMDRAIIERYLLQVGRSFYTTDEFRRQFRFVPTSRFGLGFLSVFAVSDNVIVETFKPSSSDKDGPIRLTLTGPRNYLLSERGTRRINGTEIEISLREPLAQGRLTGLIKQWCRRVEFPIHVDDLGSKSTIVSEKPSDYVCDIPAVTEDETRLSIRSFPVNRPGIEGELYVFAKVTLTGEAWDQYHWLKYEYPKQHPGAETPECPLNLDCVQGIMVSYGAFDLGVGHSARVDYRGEAAITIGRERPYRTGSDPVIQNRWEEILNEHLSTSPFSLSEDGWKYRQRLADIFELETFWRSAEGMIPLRIDGEDVLLSLDTTEQLPLLTIVLGAPRFRNRYPALNTVHRISATKIATPTLFHDLLLSSRHSKALVGPRMPVNIYWLNKTNVATDWELAHGKPQPFAKTTLSKWWLVKLPSVNSIGCPIDWKQSRASILLNTTHPFVDWLIRIKAACESPDETVGPREFETIIKLMEDPFRFGFNTKTLQNYIDAWSKIPNLPADLRPPSITFSPDMFALDDQ